MATPCIGTPFDSLSEFGTAHRYRHDTILFEQGFPAEAVYAIEEGSVALSRAESDGSTVVVGIRTKGSLVGDAAALATQAHFATAQAMTDCRVRQITAHDFRQRLKSDTAFSSWMHVHQSRELQDQAARIASLGGLTARQRLERFLADALKLAASPLDGPRRITPPIKNADLAAIIVTTPEHLSRLLRQLEFDGLIRREHGWIVALRPEALGQTRNIAVLSSQRNHEGGLA